MKTGDIVLLPFPFTDFRTRKVRPAVVVGVTKDKYKDVIVSAISSVLPDKLTANEILLSANVVNNLRTHSIIKVDRLVTMKQEDIILTLGKLSPKELKLFKKTFKMLVDG